MTQITERIERQLGMPGLADGGAVNWTQRLLSNAKERLLISGISSEGVGALAANRDDNNNNRDNNNRTSTGGTARAG